mmetsp:Transcript_45305/g.92505  ORF Transcript_45305/g.92505 Transcript_45305/m.92505 type:complete len:261 (+) Transcript_45305:1018-1800(+)
MAREGGRHLKGERVAVVAGEQRYLLRTAPMVPPHRKRSGFAIAVLAEGERGGGRARVQRCLLMRNLLRKLEHLLALLRGGVHEAQLLGVGCLEARARCVSEEVLVVAHRLGLVQVAARAIPIHVEVGAVPAVALIPNHGVVIHRPRILPRPDVIMRVLRVKPVVARGAAVEEVPVLVVGLRIVVHTIVQPVAIAVHVAVVAVVNRRVVAKVAVIRVEAPLPIVAIHISARTIPAIAVNVVMTEAIARDEPQLVRLGRSSP